MNQPPSTSPRSVRSTRSVRSPQTRLRPSGGYRDLRSFNTSTIIYDATVSFCHRFLDPRSRLVDQMTQAARSGRQNIAEGSRAAATSSQTELRLIGVARASLDELLLDYEDFLRQRKRPQWPKDHPEALAVRALGSENQFQDQSDPPNPSDLPDKPARYSHWLDSSDSATVANAIICLIHQANYLLDQQIRTLEKAFIQDGGYTEQLAAARIQARQRQTENDPSAPPDSLNPKNPIPGAPSCPRCGQPMALRTARKGAHPGSQFWGCSGYPKCKGVRNFE
jgi:restriction system protein